MDSYIVIDTSVIDEVNFAEVIEQRDTRRESVDKSEFIVKWVFGAPYIPESIKALPDENKGNVLTHEEAKELMRPEAWSTPID